MTYLEFLIIFLIFPLLFLVYYFKKKSAPNKKRFFYGIFALVILALFYTTPWDNYLVKHKIWWYGEDRVLFTIGYVPIEEYCFFFLQTIMTGLWCFFLQGKISLNYNIVKSRLKYLVLLVYGLLFMFGLYTMNIASLRYMSLILVWAMPIVSIQWAVGGNHLLNNWKLFFCSVFFPTIYLWLADALAIKLKVWEISSEFTTGIKMAGLPIEEALFFLLTNIMVIQGLILFVVIKLPWKRSLYSSD